MDCPNCVTPWKCNGPHLEKSHEGLYNSIDGYFILKQSDKSYVFIPYEKEYSTDQLLDIAETLIALTEKVYNESKS